MTQIKQNTLKPTIKKPLMLILRIALAAAPLVWIYTRTSGPAFWETLGAVYAPLLFCITALCFLCILLQGAKWWMLIHRFIPQLKLTKAVSVHMESMFYAITLPTASAQDVVKSIILSRSHNPQIVWASTWLGKLMGLFVLIILSVFGVLYLQNDLLPAGFGLSLITAFAAVTILMAASFSKRVTRPLRAVMSGIISPKIMSAAEKLRDGIYAFKHERATLLKAFLFTAAIQLLIMFAISLTIYAVCGRFHFIECLAFVSLVEIMSLSLPLTPGGLGVREALMATLFIHLGLSPEQTAAYVTISLLMYMVRLTGGIIPLYRLIGGRKT